MTGKHAIYDPNQINTAFIDEDYMVVGSHLDDTTLQKIKRCEYIDFGKLIPRDRILATEDSRMEIVMRGGHTYCVPVEETTEITNFSKWEQAFRVFSNVYTKYYLHRSSELIEYNHIIHTISLTFPWENVYLYDKDFRIHMSKHPEQNWSIILQQAWSLRLREKTNNLGTVGNHAPFSSVSQTNAKGKTVTLDDVCRHFNKGRWPFGSSCRFKHRCSYCFKFGHAILSCRKLAADLERERNRNKRNNFDRDHGDHHFSGNNFKKARDQDQKRKT